MEKYVVGATFAQQVIEAKAADDDGEISYASSNPSVAIVDAKTGKVTAQTAGEVTITATKAATPGKYRESTANYELDILEFKVKAVSAGGSSHTIAITTDGALWAWGSNRNGRLGAATRLSRTPTPVGSGKDWASVSADYSHTLAIKTDGGTVYNLKFEAGAFGVTAPTSVDDTNTISRE